MSLYTVYKHTAPNGKVYVGITSQKPTERWKNGHGYSNNMHFSRAIEKYGWECFEHEILCSGLTKENAQKKEIEYIKAHKSNEYEFGYNLSSGGEAHSGCTFGAETRLKISKANTGRQSPNKGKPLSEEQKKKLSDALKGRTVWNKGKTGMKHSAETRKKMSESQKVAQKGRKLSAETKSKIGLAMKGKLAREKNPNARGVVCLETGVFYSCIAEAISITGIKHINSVCSGTRKTAGGYHWEYASHRREVKQ